MKKSHGPRETTLNSHREILAKIQAYKDKHDVSDADAAKAVGMLPWKAAAAKKMLRKAGELKNIGGKLTTTKRKTAPRTMRMQTMDLPPAETQSSAKVFLLIGSANDVMTALKQFTGDL